MSEDEENDLPEEDLESNQEEQNSSESASKAVQKATQNKASKKATQKGIKSLVNKISAKGGAMATKAGLTATLGTILLWAFIIIMILIIIVGVVFFIVAMPGQIIGKFKKLSQDFLDVFQALVEGKENVIHTEDIAQIANYLESMGYDLKGEGFVSSSKEGDLSTTIDDDIKSNAIYDYDQDVWRNSETDEVIDLNSDSIYTYIVSDNLCYIIKNFNMNLDEMTNGHGEEAKTWIEGVFAIIGLAAAIIFSPIAAIVTVVVLVAGSALALYTASNPSWGTGLISIYHEKDGVIGVPGKAYAVSERGYIELDAKTKKLKIKRGWTNNPYIFDVDGWSGRYGMPLEFLLSVHLATQMPDLAIDMATTFETDVKVLLHGTEGSINTRIKLENGATVEYKDINTSPNGVLELINKGMPYAEGCTCPAEINPANKQTESNENSDSTTRYIDVEDTHGLLAEGYSNSNNGGYAATSDIYTPCESCINKVKRIKNALAEVQDKKYSSYTPYISVVSNHWFRDVYFVIDDPSTTELVSVDEDYFYQTNERWSVYETYKDGDTIPDGFVVGDYKLYTLTESGEYIESKLSKEEAEKINEDIANGNTTQSRLIKKPITNLIDSNYGDRWIAYELQDVESGWVDLDISEDSPSSLQEFKGKIQYYEVRPQNVVQVEDGQRGVTNSKIKEMFVNNKYYQYDGTIKRADLIMQDRKKVADKYSDNSELKGLFNTDQDPRNPDLLAKVSIAKDSLTAFSILENTHTLDADYIYRDFKELIVELNYFDKEDLSDKIQDVMQWPIPDCGSGGWPVRRYEKGETFYGTLINSKVDLELMRNADMEAAEEILNNLKNNGDPDNTTNNTTNTTGSTNRNTVTGSIGDFVSKGYEVHKIMEGNNWDYCVQSSGGCNHQYGRPCGLSPTIQEAQSSGYLSSCCATYVSWVLKEFGFDLSNHPNMNMAVSTYDWCKAEGWQAITSLSDMEPGDLLFNRPGSDGGDTSEIGHVQILGNDGEWLNAGSISAINDAPKSYEVQRFIIGMRPPLSGAAKVFEGYEPEQDVVAPVTGKIVEYGDIERVNEETGKTEKVEFIKIEAINNYLSNKKGEGYLECKELEKDKKYDTFEDKASDEAKKMEGFDYFYEEYQGVLDGFVLYIEGFDLTLFDADGAIASIEANPDTASNFSKYIENPVYNMTDNMKEAQSIWKEDAKSSAIPIVKIGEDYYIKEGTIIGKTYEDPEMDKVDIVTKDNPDGTKENSCTGNGNYIRLILRDLEDSIVEDVENYINIDDAKHTEVDWEFYYWLPYESGPLDAGNGGAAACETVSGPNEIAVGIAQWTTTIKAGGFNNIAPLCEWLVSEDSSFCAELSVFASYSIRGIIDNFSDLREAWTTVANKDKDRFLELQMKYFYENEFKNWVEDDGVTWLLEKSLVAQGTYASLKNWGPHLGWKDVINASMSDEEICKALLTKACPIDSTCGTLEARWESQYVLAKDILNGTFLDVEDWIRTKQPSDQYGEGNNSGVLLSKLILNVFNNIKADSQFLAITKKIR